MAFEAKIVCKQIVKPSSPTPHHLRHFKLSLLDQMAPQLYFPILLFYSASHVRAFGTDFNTISHNLKASLSHALNLYYPFCGTTKDNSTIECNDEGVVFIESQVPIELSNIVKTRQLDDINHLLPTEPYKPKPTETLGNMAVKLNQFKCGGIALGLSFSHKIFDASTAASFLNAWAATSRKDNTILVSPPLEEAALLFPPRNIEIFDITALFGMIVDENIVTRRILFNDTNISRLRQNIECSNFSPTRIEAVTALIWKSLLEAGKASSREENFPASIISHAVNIRNRMTPTLSKHTIGNFSQLAVSSLVEVEGEVGLRDMAERVKKTIRNIDGDYISKLQSGEIANIIQSIQETGITAAVKGVPWYVFSSWVNFDFYEVDFGWGKPTYVRPIGAPIKNAAILMNTKDGDGIEAWLTLTTHDMVQFENNSELLDFASFDS